MALSGTYSRSLDSKGRVAVPKRLREDISQDELSHLYVAPGTEKSLALYSEQEFEAFAHRLAAIPSNRATVRNYRRLFYSQAEKVDVDSQGRIRIPERLCRFAELKQNVILLGVLDHVEIWDDELWREFFSQHATDFDAMASQAFDSPADPSDRS